MKLLAADKQAIGASSVYEHPYAPSREDEETVAFLLSLRGKGIRDKHILRAFETVPRKMFVESRYHDLVRSNISLPIACGQSTLAPTTIARIISLLDIKGEHTVLEIGTGSGYVTALLARLAKLVMSFERFHTLALGAAQRLPALGITNVELYHADGFEAGYEIEAVDRIVMMGAVDDVPENVLLSLKRGGKLVAVVSENDKTHLCVITRGENDEYTLKKEETMNLPPLIPGVAQAL